MSGKLNRKFGKNLHSVNKNYTKAFKLCNKYMFSHWPNLHFSERQYLVVDTCNKTHAFVYQEGDVI